MMKANEMVIRNAAEGTETTVSFMHNASLVTSECIHEMMSLVSNGYELPTELTTVQQIHKLYEAMVHELGDGVCTNLEGITAEAKDTGNNATSKDAWEMLNRIVTIHKTSQNGYVTKAALATMLKNLTGEVYSLKNKKHTRDYLTMLLNHYCTSHPLDDESAMMSHDVQEEAAITSVKPEPVDTDVNEKWSVDYWWTPEAATHVLKRCVAQASTNNKKDFISMHMVRSIVLEMMFGKQLVEYVNKEKVVNFSKETTPREWQLASDFCNRFFNRYLHLYKGGFIINSEAMCWAYKHVAYGITVKGYKVVYDLFWDTKQMVRRDTRQVFDLTDEVFKKLDTTCGIC